jgi:hypothetical protein
MPSADYFAFVHVVDAGGDAGGRIAFQADHNLRNGVGGAASTWTASASIGSAFR